jgi:hypothetical protein
MRPHDGGTGFFDRAGPQQYLRHSEPRRLVKDVGTVEDLIARHRPRSYLLDSGGLPRDDATE